MKCRDGMVCSKVLVNCLRTSEGCRSRGVCVPTNANEQPRVGRPDRAANRELPTPNDDPCAIIQCESGTKCAVVTPMCLTESTDCRAKGVCVPTKPRPTRETNFDTDRTFFPH